MEKKSTKPAQKQALRKTDVMRMCGGCLAQNLI